MLAAASNEHKLNLQWRTPQTQATQLLNMKSQVAQALACVVLF
jgi:hypothetical protein